MVGTGAEGADISRGGYDDGGLDGNVVLRGIVGVALALLRDALGVELDRLETLLGVVIL